MRSEWRLPTGCPRKCVKSLKKVLCTKAHAGGRSCKKDGDYVPVVQQDSVDRCRGREELSIAGQQLAGFSGAQLLKHLD